MVKFELKPYQMTDTQLRGALLSLADKYNSLITKLNALDEEDVLGTEGWRRCIGYDNDTVEC